MKTKLTHNSCSRPMRSTALVVAFMAALAVPAKAGFWCEAGCYGSYAISSIGCGLSYIGDSLGCFFGAGEGGGPGSSFVGPTALPFEHNIMDDADLDAAKLAAADYLECMTNVTDANASACSDAADQDLQNCLASCSDC